MTIHLIIGPMFSNKTTTLLHLGRRHQYSGKNVLYIKHSTDQRYNNKDHIQTHDGAKQIAVETLFLSEIDPNCIPLTQVICIDEGHFFPDIVEFCCKWDTTHTIIVSALNGDYRQKPFPPISLLIGVADRITHLTSICLGCGDDAPFTKLKDEIDIPKLQPGHQDKYLPSCKKCLPKIKH